MSITTKISYLLLAMLAIIFLPWIGTSIHLDGKFPPGFFAYPMLTYQPKEPFNPFMFTLIALTFAAVAAVYIFPQWFGFKKVPVPPQREIPKVGFPIWFWGGLLVYGSALYLLWTKATGPVWYLHWSDVQLFWGLTLVIDGLVYVRNGGKSMVSRVPQEVVGIGVASIAGWMLFEYLNFFVEDNWYYPKGDIIDREQFLLYAIIISSGLLPLAFEFYSLFNSFPKFRLRYVNGWKLTLPEWSKTVLLIVALAGLLGAGLFPDDLFFSLWISPVLLLAVVLDKIGVWTPLRSIGRGNWSPTLLMALTYLAAGLCLECQNYFSATYDSAGNVLFTMAPAYWKYNLPYVNHPHLFEMPLLGYLGYLPFGVYCWIWWIACATLMGIPSEFYKDEPFTS